MRSASDASGQVLVDDALAGLDPAQIEAVTTPSTLVAVIAGAGSGKTRVLMSRIAFRIAAGTADAAHTLALTFTREAAGELRRRLRRSGVHDRVEAGTFHAVALGLVRQRRRDLDRPPLTVADDRDRLLAVIADGLPVATLATEADWSAARGIEPAGYAKAARAAARRGAVPPERIAEALAAFEALKRRRGVVDLNDLMTMAVRELEADTPWGDAIRWRYRHLLVDEAQDLNPIQYRFLELVAGTRNDLYLVGDPSQAIYGFNGSDPTFLAALADRLPGVEVIRLPTNHRCTPQIVVAAASVLGATETTSTAVSSRAEGPAVRVVAADDEDHEASLVGAFIRSLDPGVVRAGAVAVLARTNHQLARFNDTLAAAHVPLRRRRLTDGTPLGRAVRKATALPSASRLREWAHDTLDEGGDDTGDEASSDERLVAVAVLEFLREQPLGDGAALRWWIASTNPFEETGDASGVELLTFHGAKGREWPTVIVTGVETGLVPHRSATTNAARVEEARLLHVAMTRASERLVITWSRRRGGYGRRPSPLISGLDLDPPPAAPMPAELRPSPRVEDRQLADLRAWRDRAARAAGVLPSELCSDSDLVAVAAASPTSAEGLAAITGLGMLTASRLFPGLRAALDSAEG